MNEELREWLSGFHIILEDSVAWVQRVVTYSEDTTREEVAQAIDEIQAKCTEFYKNFYGKE